MAKIGKIKNSSELLWLLGIIFVALGVAICSKANVGVSMIAAPAFVIQEAVSGLWAGFTVGMVEYLVQGILLIILCLIVRKFKWPYLLAFVASVTYGYTLDLMLLILSDVEFNETWLRYVMLLVGDCCTGFGVACFFKTYLPLQVYELFVAVFSRHFKLPLPKVKWAFDIALLIISVTLAFTLFGDAGTFEWSSILTCSFHYIGIGTLITTCINAPIINFMGKIVDKLFLPTPKFDDLEKRISYKE